MCQNTCPRDAPSIFAASIGSVGSMCSAASSISITNGNHSHTSATITAHNANPGSASQTGCGRPSRPSVQSRMLISGVNRIFQISATTTGGSTIGTTNAERTTSSTFIRPLSRSAIANPLTI